MSVKRAIIVSYHYEPEITPRAFRAKSFYIALTDLGYEVEVVTCKIDYDKNSADRVSKNGNKIFKKIKNIIKRVVLFLLPGWSDLLFIPQVIRKTKNKNVDLLISVALPISSHIACYISRTFFCFKSGLTIYDYGDPYSRNPVNKACFYSKTLERIILKNSNVIFVPIKESVDAFADLSELSKIAVIPQAHSEKDICSSVYIKNKIPTFCYSGLLYKNIREPRKFLNYISNLKRDFLFVIYTDLNNTETMEILSPYLDKLGNRVSLNNMVPREVCINIMSGMDFLLNFENMSTNQSPSKLVDYIASGRPHVNLSQSDEDFEIFNEFLDGNFSKYKVPQVNFFSQKDLAVNLNRIIREFCCDREK